MEKIKLELPSKRREKDALGYRTEFRECDSGMGGMGGTGGLDKAEDYREWVQQRENSHSEISFPDGFVPASTYFAVRESDDRIVGMIDLRHYLNDFLKKSWNGHIGYSVRPTERRKGYATEMLKLALKEYEKKGTDYIIVGCDENNIGSKKTILKCGGKLVDKSIQNGKMHLGFEIKLRDSK